MSLLVRAVVAGLEAIGVLFTHLTSLDPDRLMAASVALLSLATATLAMAGAAALLGNPLAWAGLAALSLAVGSIVGDIGEATAEAGTGLDGMARLITVTTKLKKADVDNLKDVVAQVQIAAIATRSMENNSLAEKLLQAVIGAGQSMQPQTINANMSVNMDGKKVGEGLRTIDLNRDSTGVGGGSKRLGKAGG
jgi:hypothetical protein